MQYNYTKEGYHCGDVSFEVSAILLEDLKESAPQHILPGILGSDSPASLSGGYSRDFELSFNMVTDKELTVKYLGVSHHKAVLQNIHQKLKHEKERGKKYKDLEKSAAKSVKKSFSAVLQAMQAKFLLARQKSGKGRGAPKNLLDTNKINSILYSTKYSKKSAKAHEVANVKAKYSIHPHVDALLRERSRRHSMELYR